MNKQQVGSSPLNYEALGYLSRFGLSAWEIDKLHTDAGVIEWLSYKTDELECFRHHSHDLNRLLLQLTFLEVEHPDPERRSDAKFRLRRFHQNWCDETDFDDFYDAQDDPTIPDAAKI